MTRLEGIQSIMVNQIQDAWDKGVKVDVRDVPINNTDLV